MRLENRAANDAEVVFEGEDGEDADEDDRDDAGNEDDA